MTDKFEKHKNKKHLRCLLYLKGSMQTAAPGEKLFCWFTYKATYCGSFHLSELRIEQFSKFDRQHCKLAPQFEMYLSPIENVYQTGKDILLRLNYTWSGLTGFTTDETCEENVLHWRVNAPVICIGFFRATFCCSVT